LNESRPDKTSETKKGKGDDPIQNKEPLTRQKEEAKLYLYIALYLDGATEPIGLISQLRSFTYLLTE